MSEGFINRKSVGDGGSMGEAISATSTTSPLDSANGMLQGLVVFGKSEIIEGTIKSIGDDGLTVTTSNNDNTIITNFNLTTALPLCSTTDGIYDELKIEGEIAEVITRCKISNNTVVALETPVVTPLTAEEVSAFRELRTFVDKTNVVITDNPSYIITYLKNTNDGQVVANIQKNLQQQIDNISISGGDSDTGLKIKSLTYTGTNTTSNSITFPEKPSCILNIVNHKKDSIGNYNWTDSIVWAMPFITINYTGYSSGSNRASVSYTDNTMTITGGDVGLAMNRPNTEYTVYYTPENAINGSISSTVSSKLKSFTYAGTGTSTHTIVFPEEPTVVFSIQPDTDPNNTIGISPFVYGQTGMFVGYGSKTKGGGINTYHSLLSYDGNKITVTGTDAGAAQNVSGVTYTVYYITNAKTSTSVDEPVLIFSAENGTENNINYTFNDGAKLSDFKTIVVLLSTRTDLSNGITAFEENMINVNILSKQPRRLFTSYYQRYCDINFIETGFTQVRSAAPSESSGYILRIYYIYGIK